MSDTFFERKLPIHALELIKYTIPEEDVSIYRPEIISVVEVAEKFKNDGYFYLLYGENYTVILNIKNNEIIETIDVFSLIKPYKDFETIQIENTLYQRFKEINPKLFDFIEDIL